MQGSYEKLRDKLESLYSIYNRRTFVHPDPLEFVYNYEEPIDMEVAALVAACLAYGRVGQILKSVSTVLKHMGPSPASFVLSSARETMEGIYSGFRHRFTTGRELAGLLWGMGQVLREHGSMETCLASHLDGSSDTIIPALSGFIEELRYYAAQAKNSLLPDPKKGSALKRFNMFLRWMVRADEVDPGVWTCLKPSMLVIPLDVHMHRVSKELGFTIRRQADMRTALEITHFFRQIEPDDPVRYDFALTRPGILGMGLHLENVKVLSVN